MPARAGGLPSPAFQIDDALLRAPIQSLRLAAASGARGVLVVGGDACSRAAVIARALVRVDARHVGAVDDPAAATRVRALLDGPERADGPGEVVVASATEEGVVEAALRRAGRLESVVRIGPAAFGDRAAAWGGVVRELGIRDGMERLVGELAEASPAFGLGDVRRVVYAAIAECGGEDVVEGEVLLRHVREARPMAAERLDFVRYGSGVNGAGDGGFAGMGCAWEGVGGYAAVKKLMERLVKWPVLHAETFARLGVDAPRGLLLHGPSGCGKTLLVKSLLSDLHSANWLAVDAPALFSKYLGDSEARVRALFAQARQLDPCIVFLDEIDAVGGARRDESGSGVEHRVLGALLTELDGASAGRVFVIAATNDLSRVDAALYRSGRIDSVIEVGLPDEADRRTILVTLTANMSIEGGGGSVDDFLVNLARDTRGFTGADLAQLCREAAIKALGRSEESKVISRADFHDALRSKQV